ncbi:MAG: hypothetical protein EHM87_20490 [Burkholderiales bacterium]|nr:MAG: hypothetical protein EHM87_20490 [Burkholderiales bacterium]
MAMDQKKPSLWQLQDRLLEYEEQINQDETELSEILGEIAGKIDNIKQMIDIFESEAERYKRYKDEMAARQKSLQNAADRLKSYVVASLEKHNTTFEKGNIWIVKLRESKRVETFAEPEAKDMLKLAQAGLFCIKTNFTWDKTAIKEALSNEQNYPLLEEYAKIVTSKSINFSAVNAAKKEKAL